MPDDPAYAIDHAATRALTGGSLSGAVDVRKVREAINAARKLHGLRGATTEQVIARLAEFRANLDANWWLPRVSEGRVTVTETHVYRDPRPVVDERDSAVVMSRGGSW